MVFDAPVLGNLIGQKQDNDNDLGDVAEIGGERAKRDVQAGTIECRRDSTSSLLYFGLSP